MIYCTSISTYPRLLILFLNPILATLEYDKVTKPQSTSCQNWIKKSSDKMWILKQNK